MTQSNLVHNICIIGNIGSGKSTLTDLLGNAIPNSVIVPEEFAQNPFLNLYVENPTRWAFTNAVNYYYDYARLYHEKTTGLTPEHVFIDAGGATNRHVYAPYLVQENIMTPEENALYETLCALIQAHFAYPEPDAYIFLESSPEKCFERMRERGWTYQTRNLQLDYLVIIQRYLDAFQASVRQQGIPCLVLARDEFDFKSDEGQSETSAHIRPFLSQLSA